MYTRRGMCQNVLVINRRTFGTLMIGAAIAAATGCTSATKTPGRLAETLDAKAFRELISSPDVVLVDVRTPGEYQAGHLRDALLIDISAPDFASRIAALDHGKTYALYCRSANRSGQALSIMRKAGFGDVHHLAGGIGAWQATGGEIVTG